MPIKVITLILVNSLFFPPGSAAEEGNKSKDTLMFELQKQLNVLQLELAELKRTHAEEVKELRREIDRLSANIDGTVRRDDGAEPAENTPSGSEPTAGVTSAADSYSPPAGIKQDFSPSTVTGGEVFNPKISVISDFLAGYTAQSGESADDMLVREVELGFSGHVDTWGRYDLTIAMHTHPGLEIVTDVLGHDHAAEGEADGLGTEIEEGYFTFLTLPADLQARIGKVRNRVGKTNPTHLHSLQWVDYPRVIQAFLGEEGLSGSGASISWLAPWSQYTEVTYEFMKLDGEGISGIFDEEADDYSHILHANTFFEFGDNYNLEVGLSSMLSPTSEHLGFEDSWLNGVDLTFRWDPAGDGTYRRLDWRTELYNLRRTFDLDSEARELSRGDFFGMFSSLGYRFNRRFEVNGRYDYIEGPLDPDLKETSWSAYLTWWQSEYAYWRLGWMRTEQELNNVEIDPVNRLRLQFNLSLGPHPAHKY